MGTVDIVDTVDTMVDTVDTLEARGLPMPNLRLKVNPWLMLMLNTLDIPLLMDTMVDIILVLMDMDTMDTEFLVRDLLMLNLNPNTTITDTITVDSTITTIGDTMVDSLDTTIIEMFDKYLFDIQPSGSNHSIFINLAAISFIS